MRGKVIVSDESVPPTINNVELAQRLRGVWVEELGQDQVISEGSKGMGAEDFPFFSTDPDIPSVYWAIGGTPAEDFEWAAAGGPPVPSHHSPLFKIAPEPSVTRGVESAVLALMELMGTGG